MISMSHQLPVKMARLIANIRREIDKQHIRHWNGKLWTLLTLMEWNCFSKWLDLWNEKKEICSLLSISSMYTNLKQIDRTSQEIIARNLSTNIDSCIWPIGSVLFLFFYHQTRTFLFLSPMNCCHNTFCLPLKSVS